MYRHSSQAGSQSAECVPYLQYLVLKLSLILIGLLLDRCFLSDRLAYRGQQKNFQETELFMCFISHLLKLKRSVMNENQTKHMSIKVSLPPPGPTISRIICKLEIWPPIFSNIRHWCLWQVYYVCLSTGKIKRRKRKSVWTALLMLPRRPKCLRKAFSSVFEKWLNITPNPCISGHSGSFVINLVVSNFLYVYWGQTSLIVCGRKTTLKLWNDQQFFLICSPGWCQILGIFCSKVALISPHYF